MDYFVILDSTGNLVESFDEETGAREAMERIVRQDPDSADEYAMLRYDATGHPIGDAVQGSEFGSVHA
jgi:hypothetical protein